MKTKTWGTLDYRDLALLFGKMFQVDTNIGRDTSLLKRLAEEQALQPIQILYGFVIYKQLNMNRYIVSFCENHEKWKCDDILEAAAEVRAYIEGTALPYFYWEYVDTRAGGDIGGSLSSNVLRLSKNKLQELVNDFLNKPISPRDRTLFAQRDNQRTNTISDPSQFGYIG